MKNPKNGVFWNNGEKIRFLGFFDLFEFFKLYLREFFEIFSILFKFFGCCVAVGAYLFFEPKFFESKIFIIFEEVKAYFYFFSSLLKTFLLRFYLVVFLWRSKRLFLIFLVKKWRNFFKLNFFESNIFCHFWRSKGLFLLFFVSFENFFASILFVSIFWRSKRLFLIFLVKKWRNFCFFFSPRFHFFVSPSLQLSLAFAKLYFHFNWQTFLASKLGFSVFLQKICREFFSENFL